MNTFDLSLDLDKRAGVTQWVTLRQGDHDGTQLRATIYDHGTQVSGSYTCRVSIRKPTDNEYYRETCSFSGGVATVTIDEQYAASEVGITYGYFELLQGTAVIASTESFGVRILPSAIDGAIVAPPYDSAIEDALAELDEATGRISQMVIDATAEYLEAHPEITTTVQDNSLTDAKLVQSGGILSREQWLETMLPNIPRKATAEADVHSVTDSAGGGPLGITVYGRSTQDGTPTPDAPVAIESVDASRQLVDYGEMPLPASGSTSNEYWYAVNPSYWTQLEDGWMHFEYTGDGSTSYVGVMPKAVDGIEAASDYTALIELRNVSRSDGNNVASFNFGATSSYQLSGNNLTSIGNGAHWHQLTSRADVSAATRLLQSRVFAPASGVTLSFDLRFSIWEGTYDGGWGPHGEFGLGADAGSMVTETFIPIDLQGHALRSLPDGTRDEVTVDEWGHAILTQRVGFIADLSAATVAAFSNSDTTPYITFNISASLVRGVNSGVVNTMSDAYQGHRRNDYQSPCCYVTGNGGSLLIGDSRFAGMAQADALALLSGVSAQYALATPQTIDLGYLDPALLPAPDLTAYVVPSAPSVLRYGFDVAAAIAEIATA